MIKKQLHELDAWIAERVMGWHWTQAKPCREGVDTTAFAFWDGKDGSTLASNWKPTTDPAAAMMVLEKCCNHTREGYACISKSQPCDSEMDKKNGHWTVGIVSKEFMHEFGTSGNALTLPLAICLFAKKLFTK